MQLLASHNVKLVTFPPRTLNLFQPLDLVDWSVLKLEEPDTKNETTRRISRIANYKGDENIEASNGPSTKQVAFKGEGQPSIRASIHRLPL
jgi:hypothetical protein